MKRSGLTISIIFEAQSANYGEGMGNITTLKKMTRGDGKVYSYISRQAMRYNIVQQMNCDNTPVTDENTVVQFASSASVKDYPEIDLFGYMKTSSKDGNKKGGQQVRSAVARLSNAISLHPYASDMDFLTNMGLAKRGDFANAIANSEIHNSFYAYTVTVDLDKVGIDENDATNIPDEEKKKRVIKLIETLQFLYRDIKGRRENLAPVFAIGGVYERKNPYFESRLEMKNGELNCSMICDVINACDDTKAHTHVGMFEGKIKNASEAKSKLSASSISDMFEAVKKEVAEYYD